MTAQPKPRTIPFNVLCKYPFLNASIAWIQEKNVTPIEALYNHATLMDKIRTLVSDALDNMEQTKALGYDDDEGLYIYPWIRIILAFMNMPRLTHKVGNLLSKHFSNLLEHENDFTVLIVARDQAINAEQVPSDKAIAINTVSFPYRLPFLDFLNIAARFKSQAWKLVNKLLQSGHVYLRKHDLVRMLEEIVKLKVIEPSAAASDETLKDAFMTDPLLKPFYDGIVAAVKEKMASASGGSLEKLPVDDSAFPPCINAILAKNAKGINLAHTERLFLVYFLLTIGKTVDEVLDLFRSQPDYNEKITKYQVEFAAGKHGKQTQYKPHNCVTLESIGVCKKDDPQFGSKSCTEPKTPFKNPLTFYRRRTWYKAKKASEAAAVQIGEDEDENEDPGVDPRGTAPDALGDSDSHRA
jgi:DNA primase large subunit